MGYENAAELGFNIADMTEEERTQMHTEMYEIFNRADPKVEGVSYSTITKRFFDMVIRAHEKIELGAEPQDDL